MAFVEHIASFFDVTSGFAVPAVWSHDGSTVNVIFDAAYVDPMGLFEGSLPTAWCEAATVVGVAQGQTLTIDSVVYTIVETQPDGTGVAVLRMRR